MKKEQLASRLAQETHVSPAAAADQLDRIVSDMLMKVRRGQAASLPGLGTFQSGSEKEFQFDRNVPPDRRPEFEKEVQVKEPRSSLTPARHVARILRRALEHGAAVEIDGLGTFLPGQDQGFRFIAQNSARVFIAYVEEDLGVGEKAVFHPGGARISTLAG